MRPLLIQTTIVTITAHLMPLPQKVVRAAELLKHRQGVWRKNTDVQGIAGSLDIAREVGNVKWRIGLNVWKRLAA